MKPTNQLFDIIKSLTPEEEKKFILLSSLQQGEKNYIKLYNFIQKQDSYDEDLVKSHFKNEIFGSMHRTHAGLNLLMFWNGAHLWQLQISAISLQGGEFALSLFVLLFLLLI